MTDKEIFHATVAEAQAWVMLLGRWPSPLLLERLTIIVREYDPAERFWDDGSN